MRPPIPALAWQTAKPRLLPVHHVPEGSDLGTGTGLERWPFGKIDGPGRWNKIHAIYFEPKQPKKDT